jgi:FkbM family methyltransferase
VSRMWIFIKSWLPIVKLFPVSTFRSRFWIKITRLKCRLFINLMPGARGYAARVADVDHNSQATLVLNRKSPLGKKGTRLHIPIDEGIYQEVREFGSWEIDEVKFLIDAVNRPLLSGANKKIFLDIGANVGLTSRQVLLKSKVKTEAVLVEPIPTHVDAINYNLTDLAKTMHLDVHPFALGPENSTSTIFIEGRNNGNSSMIRGVVPIADSESAEIKVVSVVDFAATNLRGSEKIILKCDTQGFDASILARLPKSVWERVDAAVIEIWAIPEIDEEDVSMCLGNWADFTYVHWSGRSFGRVPSNEISEYWLSKSLETKNLFLRR